jgi:hypothetical protein
MPGSLLLVTSSSRGGRLVRVSSVMSRLVHFSFRFVRRSRSVMIDHLSRCVVLSVGGCCVITVRTSCRRRRSVRLLIMFVFGRVRVHVRHCLRRRSKVGGTDVFRNRLVRLAKLVPPVRWIRSNLLFVRLQFVRILEAVLCMNSVKFGKVD